MQHLEPAMGLIESQYQLASILTPQYIPTANTYYTNPFQNQHTQLSSSLYPLPYDRFHRQQQPHLMTNQTHTQPIRPLIAHLLQTPPESKTTKAVAPTEAHSTKQNILMRNPFRQLGFLNEYAEVFKSLMPKSIYNSLWAIEMAYVGSESVLSTLINARQDAIQKHLPSSHTETVKSDFTHLGKRAVFHSIAAAGLPTLLISGISPFAGKEMHGLAGGLKGVSEFALKHVGASPSVIKYGTVGLTFLTLPFMSKFLDPIVEKALHKVIPTE